MNEHPTITKGEPVITDILDGEKRNDDDFEIVIGIVAPIGTDLEGLFPHLQRALRQFDYSSSMVRLSQLLTGDSERHRSSTVPLNGATGACIAERLMNAGDQLRSDYESADALAALAIAKIASIRKEKDFSSNQSTRHAWILRTLKHEHEIELLKHVYGRRFLLIGAYQNERSRSEKLASDLADELPGRTDLNEIAVRLLARDQLDSQTRYGQRVRDTYSMADYFVNLDSVVDQEVDRLIGLLFGKAFLTPTRDEQAMFQAYATAFRSADSGRQVGAVVTTPGGDLIVTGTNEVPVAGGGNYWADDPGDKRDFARGHDFNKKLSTRAIKEFMSFMTKHDFLSDELKSKPFDEQHNIITEVDPDGFKGLRLMSLIEFGRIAHAEMSAITQAARSTSSIDGGTLYSTTFPCHMCMRLIIASGVARVVYVDPYPKSLALEMYGDSLGGPNSTEQRAVQITPFWGASWSVFPHLFRMINRDKDAHGNFTFGQGKKHRMRLVGHEPLAGALRRERDVYLSIETGLTRKGSYLKELPWLIEVIEDTRMQAPVSAESAD